MIFPQFKDGDALTPAHMNAIFAELLRWQALSGTGGIIVNGARGNGPPTIEDYTAQPGDQLAYTDGTITARSGTTAGTGTVFIVTDVESSGAVTLTTGTDTLAVFNYSGTAGGIPTGKYCWIRQSPNGNWFIVSAEC